MNFSELARQASATGDGSELSGDAVQRFGELVAAAAYDECANIVDVRPDVEAWEIHGGQETIDVLREVAATIRARSNAEISERRSRPLD